MPDRIPALAAQLPPDTPITSLPGLTWHATRPLENAGLATLGDLANTTTEQLHNIPGLGERRLHALANALRAHADNQQQETTR